MRRIATCILLLVAVEGNGRGGIMAAALPITMEVRPYGNKSGGIAAHTSR